MLAPQMNTEPVRSEPKRVTERPPLPPSSRRRFLLPLCFMVLLIGTGMAYSLLWEPVVHGASAWVQSGDLWDTFHAAEYVGWGDYGQVYASGGSLVTLPAIVIVLAPVGIVASHLHWSVSFPYFLPHPQAWPLLDGTALLLTGTALFPVDALATQVGVAGRRRWVLLGAVAALLFWMTAMWGHPEDAVALGLTAAAILATLRSQGSRAGWMMGAAIAFQPVVVMAVPVLVAVQPDARRRISFLVQSALPAAVLLILPLTKAYAATVHAIVDQPNFPAVDHKTPWLFLAPVIEKAHRISGNQSSPLAVGRHGYTAVMSQTGETVSAGPGRSIAIFGAILIGLAVWRRRQGVTDTVLLWAVALAFSLRPAFESVMNPYYFAPGLLFVMLAGSLRGRTRYVLVLGSTAAVIVYSQHFFSPWIWWAPLMGLTAMGLAAAWPSGQWGATLSDGPARDPLRSLAADA